MAFYLYSNIHGILINILKMTLKNKLTFVFIIFLALTTKLNGQANKYIESDIKVQSQRTSKNIDIEFKAEQEIYNLLIVIADSLGQTMFLDNQYRFKGNYKKSIDFSKAAKGNYTVKITRDKEQFNKKVSIQ